MSQEPSLSSHIASFDGPLRLLIATAARAASSARLPPDQAIDIKDVNILSNALAAFSLDDDEEDTPKSKASGEKGRDAQAKEVQQSAATAASTTETTAEPQLSEADKERELGVQAKNLRVLMSANAAERAKRETLAKQWADEVARHCQFDPLTLPPKPRVADIKRAATELSEDKHLEILHDLLLLSLHLPPPAKTDQVDPHQAKAAATKPAENAGVYTPLSRYLLFATAAILNIPPKTVFDEEKIMSQELYFVLNETEKADGKDSKSRQEADRMRDASQGAIADRDKKSTPWKWAATGAGFLVGGVALGITGGLAAPLVAPLLVSVTGGALSFLATSGGAVLLGTMFGLTGGGLTAFRAKARMQGIEEFEFVKIEEEDAPKIPSLSATIIASGFLTKDNGYIEPYREYFTTKLRDRRDAYALKAESAVFLGAGKSLDNYVKNFLVGRGVAEVIKRTALATVFAAIALPATVYKTACRALDNDFQRSTDRTQKAGIILADVLEKGVQGNRPTVLIGTSLGAVTVMTCLLELHKRNLSGLVFDAILISLPAAPGPSDWLKMRQVTSRRLVNAYSSKDWVLAIIARLHTLISTRLSFGVAGLQAIKVENDCDPSVITNIDLSDILDGHLGLQDSAKMTKILERINLEI